MHTLLCTNKVKATVSLSRSDDIIPNAYVNIFQIASITFGICMTRSIYDKTRSATEGAVQTR